MDNKKIGKTISNLRKQKNLTQTQLAEQIFVSAKAISKWETGEGVPEVSNLKVLADFFNVTMDYIINGDGSEGVAPKSKAQNNGLQQDINSPHSATTQNNNQSNVSNNNVNNGLNNGNYNANNYNDANNNSNEHQNNLNHYVNLNGNFVLRNSNLLAWISLFVACFSFLVYFHFVLKFFLVIIPGIVLASAPLTKQNSTETKIISITAIVILVLSALVQLV